MIRILARAGAITILVIGIPGAAGAVITYHLLDSTTWTDPKSATEPTDKAKPAPPAVQPPLTERHPLPAWRNRWPIGTCVSHDVQPTPCTSPGAYRIIASIHRPGPRPCRGLPETDTTRRTGAYALCLTALPW